MVKKLLEILSPDGTYNYRQFRLTEMVTMALIIVLPFLFLVHESLLAIVFFIFIEVLLLYVRSVSVIKRLRGVGRPAGDFFKLYIPFVDWQIQKELWNETSIKKEGELTEEQYTEITRKNFLRENQMPDYESEYRRFKKRSDDY